MRISRLTLVGSAVALLLLGVAGLVAILIANAWLVGRAEEHTKKASELGALRSAAVELRSALQAAESSQRGYIASKNEIYLAPFDRAKDVAMRHMRFLKDELSQTEEFGVLITRLSSVVDEKIAEMNESIALITKGDDRGALDRFSTDRGKALMDEANVFLSGIVRSTEKRLHTTVNEQGANATLLRSVTIAGALVIALVVIGIVLTFTKYTREITRTRDEVRLLNLSLESRVRDRTIDLEQAKTRAELLLKEVNHRVANSLALVASMVRLQSRAVEDQAARTALAETEARISTIASVHKRLYSSGSVQSVALNEYLGGILENLSDAMRNEGLRSDLDFDLDPLELKTDLSVNLGIIATEWVTNAFKYAYGERGGKIRVSLKRVSENTAELIVEDWGIGKSRNSSASKGTGLGTKIVGAMANTMKAEAHYAERKTGTAAHLVFPLQD